MKIEFCIIKLDFIDDCALKALLCNAEVNYCDFVQTRQIAYRWKALTSEKTILHRFVNFSKNWDLWSPSDMSFGPEVVLCVDRYGEEAGAVAKDATGTVKDLALARPI